MGKNILVVDDSSVIRKVIIRTLGNCGIELGQVFEANNGQEGLTVLGQNKVDVVLVDINMPVMGGIEMVEQIRQDPKIRHMPVIFVSSESSSSRIEMLLRTGAGFVHKPFHPESLRENILNVTSNGGGS